MGQLTSLRTELHAALTAAGVINPWPHVPETITPPATVIVPAADWITRADATFGEYRVQFDAIVLRPGTNQTALVGIEDETERILDAIENQGWAGSVAEPYIVTLGGAMFLAAAITITT